MALTRREAFAQVMEHLCTHDGDGGHGYSQHARWGDGTSETIALSDGGRVQVPNGDFDCSSGIITALKVVGVDVHGATYTGNMRECLMRTGLFAWWPVGVSGKEAQRGDIYLNHRSHTAMCTSAVPDMLAQFSIAENGTVHGRQGDQTGRESNIRSYYNYPWDGKLHWMVDGGELGGGVPSSGGSPSKLDVDGWAGQHTTLVWQQQVGTVADGVISGQSAANKQYLERLVSVTWEGGGSQLIRAVQLRVGVYADGYIGPETVRGVQRWLNSRCGAGLDVDGYFGPLTAKALQRSLNEGRWAD